MTHRRQEIEAFVRNRVVEVEVAEAEGIATGWPTSRAEGRPIDVLSVAH